MTTPTDDEVLVERLRELRRWLWPAETVPGDGPRVRHVAAVDAAIDALTAAQPDRGEITSWATETLSEARAGRFDLRDLGKAMNGKWDQDFPAMVLKALASQASLQGDDGEGVGASPAATGLAGAEAPEPPPRLGSSSGIPSAWRPLDILRAYGGDIWRVCEPPEDHPDWLVVERLFSGADAFVGINILDSVT